MFNLNALLKFINTNNDGFVQKSEIQEFIGTQKSPSIFSGYLSSISNDVDNNTFLNDMFSIMQRAKKENNLIPQLDFTDENMANKFQQLNEQQEKEDIAQIKSKALYRYGVKTENMEEFENLFNQLIKYAQENGESYDLIFQKFKELEYTKPITMEMVKASNSYDISLPDNLVFEDMDWSNSREVFNYLSFNDKTFSQTSKQNLPQGYDPQEVFEKGKTIGLGIDDVHAMGYTGKGVSVAICDWQLKPHKDLNIKDYHCAKHASEVDEYFHASAVTGILAGQQTGIAPDSDVYFFAERRDQSENGGSDMINTLQSIINKNKELPDDKKIRVISISGPIYGDEEKVSALVKELTDSGVWVLSSDEFWENFGYLDKKDPMGNPNDFNNYQINRGEWNENALYVNSGNRTVPDPSGETAYRHDSRASASWAIPVVAGYYALACQADPDMTPEKFIDLAHQTAHIQESSKYEYAIEDVDENIPIGRSQTTQPIQIIDINALLQKIETVKNKI